MSDEQKALLDAVRRTAEKVQDTEAALAAARRDYWQALSDAHGGGLSLGAIGRELGITRQRVKRLIDSR